MNEAAKPCNIGCAAMRGADLTRQAGDRHRPPSQRNSLDKASRLCRIGAVGLGFFLSFRYAAPYEVGTMTPSRCTAGVYLERQIGAR